MRRPFVLPGPDVGRLLLDRLVAEGVRYGRDFALAVLEGKSLPYGIEDAIQNMRILDALFRSDVEGGWVSL